MNKFIVSLLPVLLLASLASYGDQVMDSQVTYNDPTPLTVNLNGASQIIGMGQKIT